MRAASSDNEDIAWSAALRALVRLPSPPRSWLKISGWLLLACAVTIVCCIWAGIFWRGKSYYQFGERKAATFASVGVLIACGVACALIGKDLRAAGVAKASPSSFHRFWFLAAGLFLWMGLDDLLEFHEHLDFAIHSMMGWNPKGSKTDKIDDLIVAAYGLVALAMGWKHRRYLIRMTLTIQVLAIAFFFFVAMVWVDMYRYWIVVEESLKLAAATLILIALLAAPHDLGLAKS
jgi:hypothetical protein